MISFNVSPKFKAVGIYSVSIGYKIAQQLVNHPEFIEEILKVEKFTYTKESPQDVAKKLSSIVASPEFKVFVNPFYYRNSSVVAMTEGDGSINVNTNGIAHRSSENFICNALHELAHYPLGYGHGSNFPNGFRSKLMGDFADKELSVPYVFAKIGLKIYRKIL
jgi:hypothetical protein